MNDANAIAKIIFMHAALSSLAETSDTPERVAQRSWAIAEAAAAQMPPDVKQLIERAE